MATRELRCRAPRNDGGRGAMSPLPEDLAAARSRVDTAAHTGGTRGRGVNAAARALS